MVQAWGCQDIFDEILIRFSKFILKIPSRFEDGNNTQTKSARSARHIYLHLSLE